MVMIMIIDGGFQLIPFRDARRLFLKDAVSAGFG